MYFLLKATAVLLLVFYMMGEAPDLSATLGLAKDKGEAIVRTAEKAEALMQLAGDAAPIGKALVAHTLKADDLAAPFKNMAPAKTIVSFSAPLPKPRPL